MIEIIVIALGWAIWDLFVFALPKDNGYFSLKTKGPVIRWDFPHHIKIITLGVIAYLNTDSLFILIVCGFVAFNIQVIFYNALSHLLNKKKE